jgi:hypothetical protein
LAQEKNFEVIISTPALIRYQEVVLDYLSDHFSAERVAEIDDSIFDLAASLAFSPFRGTPEKYLDQLEKEFRFILFKESRSFEIKIIYFISEHDRRVFITDFFPTRMNPQDDSRKALGEKIALTRSWRRLAKPTQGGTIFSDNF